MAVMPAVPAPPAFPPDWRWHHAHAAQSLSDVERLFPGRFDLSRLDRPGIERAAALYGMRATPYYLALARAADPRDPVWALAVPDPRELVVRREEREDPTGDEVPRNHPLAAVTRRYPDRALLLVTPTCSVHCRHCFRKRLVGNAEYAVDEAALQAALDWIAGQAELREVILTGGDPLTLSDERLLSVLRRLDGLPQLRALRVHTRLPVVNPYRVTEELAGALAGLRLPLAVGVHFNHPVEVTAEAAAATRRLHARGVAVLNQAVLLAGINDDPDVHRELLWALHAARVRPYALHHADLVPGTSHLRTSVQRGYALMRALRGSVPGHLLPWYLLDVPGGHGKVPLDYPWVQPGVQGGLRVEAPDGTHHDYGVRVD
ncbi:MAG: KamA family radical SAM protein [Planctomycetes bacterium]|nr:KamA family radical SAM protein [Planctomycetota bacterium]